LGWERLFLLAGGGKIIVKDYAQKGGRKNIKKMAGF